MHRTTSEPEQKKAVAAVNLSFISLDVTEFNPLHTSTPYYITYGLEDLTHNGHNQNWTMKSVRSAEVPRTTGCLRYYTH